MKDFERRTGRLRALPLQARVVYTVFLLFTLAGLGVTAWLADEMVGLDLHGVGAYYAGEAEIHVEREPPGDDDSGGPALILPKEASEVGALSPMATRKLLEVTHFHLFSMPVYLLILSHLFMLSRARPRARWVWIGIGTLSTLGHMAAPFVARQGGGTATAFYGATGFAMAVSYLWMALVPLAEMWGPDRRGRPEKA